MIPTTEFHTALNVAVCHATTTAIRAADMPHLQNIFFCFQPNNILTLVGTDGHRMATIDLHVAHGQPAGLTFPLYIEYARKLLKELRPDLGGPLTVAPFGSDLMIAGCTTCHSFPAPAVPVEAPAWQSVMSRMPAVQGGELRLDAQFIIDALTACKPLMADMPRACLRVADNTPLFIQPVLRSGLTAIQAVTIAIMYTGAL